MSWPALAACALSGAIAAGMAGFGIGFILSRDYLYGSILCGSGVIFGFCAAMLRTKAVMDAELRSYDERGRELSRLPCAWDHNGADGEGEVVFFKEGIACGRGKAEDVGFIPFSGMDGCGLDGDEVMVVLKDKQGVLVLSGGDVPKSKAILSRLESNGVRAIPM